MNKLQLRSLFGYVIVSVKGENIIKFLQHCHQRDLLLWKVEQRRSGELIAYLYSIDYPKVKEIAQEINIDLNLLAKKGLFVRFFLLFQEKEKIVGFLAALILLFYFSNTVSHIHIAGVHSYLESEIDEQLKELGIVKGSFQIKAPPVVKVEQHLMERLPELLYISVQKRGTIYTIEAIEKRKENKEEDHASADLIAKKSGFIRKMLIKNGQALVQVNDFVQKGDKLVRGELTFHEEEKEADQQEDSIYVKAEGDVFANTWYEVDLVGNIAKSLEKLEGNPITHYHLNIGKLTIPLLIWPKVKGKQIETLKQIHELKLFQRQLPIKLIEKTSYEKMTEETKQPIEEAKEKAIEFMKKDLKRKLGKESEIEKYYILHEVEDNGKVKLRLYVSVIENIAQTKRIDRSNE